MEEKERVEEDSLLDFLLATAACVTLFRRFTSCLFHFMHAGAPVERADGFESAQTDDPDGFLRAWSSFVRWQEVDNLLLCRRLRVGYDERSFEEDGVGNRELERLGLLQKKGGHLRKKKESS